MTITELLEDLLTEFDELDMQPMIIVPNPLERAKSWKHELEYALKHLKSEVAREIFAEISNLLLSFVYLGADGKWHTGKKYANELHSFMENYLNLQEKYVGEQTNERPDKN